MAHRTTSVLIFLAVLVMGLTAWGVYRVFGDRRPYIDIPDGRKVSGEIEVPVQAGSRYGMFALCIDGRQIGAESAPETGPVHGVGFQLPTYQYANGTHLLDLKVGTRTVDRRRVIFLNKRIPLHAAVLTRWDVPVRITGTVYPDAPWKAVVQDGHGHALRTWNGTGYAIDLAWEGLDNSGKPVANGAYRFILTTAPLGETYSCPLVKKIRSAP